MPHLKNFLTVVLVIVSTICYPQQTISGIVTDLLTEQPLEKVKISLLGGESVTITDRKGSYEITIPTASATLVFTLDRYISESIKVNNLTKTLNISLILDTDNLKKVVLVGSRFKPRSVADSPVPIDNIQENELRSAGHHDLDMMMMYNIPSFNSTIQTVSDATAHFNPADLRGLGPSRTLILINGKRKNYSSHIYINDTPGKGEVGVDLTTIPISAIERVEVLRNGASAQYGSDAIAGVVNIILKENIESSEINTISGINQEGDGLIMGFDAHLATSITDKGFINISTNFKHQKETNRSGTPGSDVFFGNILQDPSLTNGTNPWIQSNPDLGMVIGQPSMTTNNIFINAKYEISPYSEFYTFAGTTYRNGKSFGVLRPPYIANDYQLYNGIGFLPNFQTNINDITFSLGLRGQKNGWEYDISSTKGENKVSYIIGNTLNDSLKSTSPTRFDAGGYKFSQIVNNLDISRQYSNIDIGFGFEFRNENFAIEAGEENSYIGNGAISFPGIQPMNEVNENRHNLGVYIDIQSQLSKQILVGGAIRYENYSDFGSRFNWMINTKLDLPNDKINLRSSISTGFRAPSLHQIHLSNIQTLISGGTLSEQGTFKNNSTVLRAFDVQKLKEETSINFSVGITFQPFEKILITADYFSIALDDRIVFTGAIGDDGDPNTTTQTESILADFNITSFKFFTNALDTHTDGFDLVASYDRIAVNKGMLNISLTGNLTQTIIHEDIKTSQKLESEGNSLFNRKEQARVTSARPDTKFILSSHYQIGKFNFGLYNTRFGEVTWQHASDEAKDQIFSAQIITDLNIDYQLLENFQISVGANNLFDIYPDEINTNGDSETDLGGRFKYAWEVNQFGFNGQFIYGKIKFTL